MLEKRLPISVSALNSQVRQLLEDRCGTVLVEAEISNFVAASSGHWYFSLKDEHAEVRCAMFRGNNLHNRFHPANGDLVIVDGRVTLYEQRGNYQIIVNSIASVGDGTLLLAFEQLKKKLEAEGLFSTERKQQIPVAPRRVALVTSESGAALQDMLSVMNRRSPGTEILLIPVPVQGQEAPAAICTALQTLAQRGAALGVECVILGRGGGSMEDLQAFNDEALARAIADMPIPIVSAVGHETDITIADFVADHRAPTPSAAAELVTPNDTERHRQLQALGERLSKEQQTLLHSLQQRLAIARMGIRHPRELLERGSQHLDELEGRLRREWQRSLQSRHQRLMLTSARLQHPGEQLRTNRDRSAMLTRRLQQASTRMLEIANGGVVALHARLQLQSTRIPEFRGRLVLLSTRLQSSNPLGVLKRGYALVHREDSTTGATEPLVRDPQEAPPGTRLRIRVHRGSLEAEVTGTST